MDKGGSGLWHAWNSAESRNLNANLAFQVLVNIYLFRYFIPHIYHFKCSGYGMRASTCALTWCPINVRAGLALARGLEPDCLPWAQNPCSAPTRCATSSKLLSPFVTPVLYLKVTAPTSQGSCKNFERSYMGSA